MFLSSCAWNPVFVCACCLSLLISVLALFSGVMFSSSGFL